MLINDLPIVAGLLANLLLEKNLEDEDLSSLLSFFLAGWLFRLDSQRERELS